MRKQLKSPFDNYFITEDGTIFNYANYQLQQTPTIHGYYQVHLFNGKTLAPKIVHRLVAEYFLKDWDPKSEVDHIDMNKLNNHYSNLRMATRSQNNANTDKRPNNTSGFKGVVWSKQHKKWQSRCKKDGQQYFFGYFDNKLDAARAYMEGAKKLYGEYARWTPIPETDQEFFDIAISISLPESPTKMKIKFIKPKLSISDDEIDV